jgi:hypothetical protein
VKRESGIVVMIMACFFATASADEPPAGARAGVSEKLQRFVRTYCIDCHDSQTPQADLSLASLLERDLEKDTRAWESVVRKLAARQMPPRHATRPQEPEYQEALSWLTERLDQAAATSPNPGRTASLRRLTRTEYGHAIRDLLGLSIDASQWLPADESSLGFDNITVTDLSPTLLNRYLLAAQIISRRAVGATPAGVESATYRLRADVTQDQQRMPGLPLGTRGGLRVSHHFPRDGEYEVQISLMRDRNDELEGLHGAHELELLLDRERLASHPIRRPSRGENDRSVESQLTTRFRTKAGPHELGVTFVAKPFSLLETERQPLNVHYNFYRHPRLGPAIYQVSINGPFGDTAPGDSPSRKKIFTSRPSGPNDLEAHARTVLTPILRRAYRRPVDASDLEIPLKHFRLGVSEAGAKDADANEAEANERRFELGVERALAAILVNPQFLFRVERDPADAASRQPYRISPFELASRLSFFLWSSIPDDELLDLAISDQLKQPAVLDQQVRRMLADDRARSLVTNFADQWLYLRNLEATTPDSRLFPDFDQNLRDAFRRETELLFEEIIREDRSILTLINSPHTYLNERLAKHYGIPHVQGSHFRRVALEQESRRGGILRHGSILSVTSYATRTSPVIRGKWVLENLLGSPPPPPPPDVPTLEDNTVAANLPLRQRLAEHRANAACAVCHDAIDPIGFALENFDAVGRWRVQEFEQPIDATGSLPGSNEFQGVEGLERAILQRPELLATTLSEKLLTFALGRGVSADDAPAIRQIVRDAKNQDYRFSALILGIVHSVPFQMRSPEQAGRDQLDH